MICFLIWVMVREMYPVCENYLTVHIWYMHFYVCVLLFNVHKCMLFLKSKQKNLKRLIVALKSLHDQTCHSIYHIMSWLPPVPHLYPTLAIPNVPDPIAGRHPNPNFYFCWWVFQCNTHSHLPTSHFLLQGYASLPCLLGEFPVNLEGSALRVRP